EEPSPPPRPSPRFALARPAARAPARPLDDPAAPLAVSSPGDRLQTFDPRQDVASGVAGVLHLEIAAQELARFLERRCMLHGSPSRATTPSYHCRSRKALSPCHVGEHSATSRTRR